jgi:hypothetical protein
MNSFSIAKGSGRMIWPEGERPLNEIGAFITFTYFIGPGLAQTDRINRIFSWYFLTVTYFLKTRVFAPDMGPARVFNFREHCCVATKQARAETGGAGVAQGRDPLFRDPIEKRRDHPAHGLL